MVPGQKRDRNLIHQADKKPPKEDGLWSIPGRGVDGLDSGERKEGVYSGPAAWVQAGEYHERGLDVYYKRKT